jgi:hypothetical protein
VTESHPAHNWLSSTVRLRGGAEEEETMVFNDLYRRIRYRKDNPLRDYHVPRRHRLDADPPRVLPDTGDFDDHDSRRVRPESEGGVG